jgi:hypothetical protein
MGLGERDGQGRRGGGLLGTSGSFVIDGADSSSNRAGNSEDMDLAQRETLDDLVQLSSGELLDIAPTAKPVMAKASVKAEPRKLKPPEVTKPVMAKASVKAEPGKLKPPQGEGFSKYFPKAEAEKREARDLEIVKKDIARHKATHKELPPPQSSLAELVNPFVKPNNTEWDTRCWWENSSHVSQKATLVGFYENTQIPAVIKNSPELVAHVKKLRDDLRSVVGKSCSVCRCQKFNPSDAATWMCPVVQGPLSPNSGALCGFGLSLEARAASFTAALKSFSKFETTPTLYKQLWFKKNAQDCTDAFKRNRFKGNEIAWTWEHSNHSIVHSCIKNNITTHTSEGFTYISFEVLKSSVCKGSNCGVHKQLLKCNQINEAPPDGGTQLAFVLSTYNAAAPWNKAFDEQKATMCTTVQQRLALQKV